MTEGGTQGFTYARQPHHCYPFSIKLFYIQYVLIFKTILKLFSGFFFLRVSLLIHVGFEVPGDRILGRKVILA